MPTTNPPASSPCSALTIGSITVADVALLWPGIPAVVTDESVTLYCADNGEFLRAVLRAANAGFTTRRCIASADECADHGGRYLKLVVTEYPEHVQIPEVRRPVRVLEVA
jgi:hypothetical protein